MLPLCPQRERNACPQIHARSKRRLQMEVGRKYDLFKSKTSWTSLTHTPSLLCPEHPPTCGQSVCPSSLQSPDSPYDLTTTSVFTTTPSQHAPMCFATSGWVCLQTNSLSSWDFLKWIFSSADTSLWMHHKRWHFSRAGCFWKNILNECQARPHEMSWWLSKETCQELGWVKIATAWCRCEESKDHWEKSLFVFKIIIPK